MSNKVRAPRPGESISWRPKHQRLAPMTPVAPTPIAPKAAAPTTPKAKPVDAAYQQQLKDWAKEKQAAEAPVPTWVQEQPPHGLLDDLSPDLSPEERHVILLTRIDHMRDSR